MRQRERCQFGVGAEDGAVRACQGFSSPVWVVSPGRLLTARLSGHQVMIDGHALSPPLSFVAAIPADPESRSKVSARSQAGTNDLDGRRSFDEANRSRRARRVLGHVRSDSAVDQGMDEAVVAASYLPGPRELLDACTDQGAEAEAIAQRSAARSRGNRLLASRAGSSGWLAGPVADGTTLPVERLVAAQQLPVGERPGSGRQRRGVANQSPAQGTEPG